VTQIYQLLATNDLLAARLGDGSDRSRRTRLGHLLATQEGREIGPYRIAAAGERRGSASYRLLSFRGMSPRAVTDERAASCPRNGPARKN
jgi:hypothetical protein